MTLNGISYNYNSSSRCMKVIYKYDYKLSNAICKLYADPLDESALYELLDREAEIVKQRQAYMAELKQRFFARIDGKSHSDILAEVQTKYPELLL